MAFTNKRNPRLRLFQKYDKNNQAIPSSSVLRYHIPKDGKWKDISIYNDLCCITTEDCGGNIYVVFENASTNGQTITGISFPDFTPTITPIALGGLYVVAVPKSTTSVTITVNPNGHTIAAASSATSVGTGTASPACQAAGAGNQYTFTLAGNACDTFLIQLLNVTTCS